MEEKLVDWVKEFPASVMVCDTEGVILMMNDHAIKAYARDGGKDLIGKNALDCHPEPARSLFKKLLETQQKHAYTIEKRGVNKVIYQSPWYENGEYRGMVELSLEVPAEMPHFNRDAQRTAQP